MWDYKLIITISIPLLAVVLGHYINYRIVLRRKRKSFFYKSLRNLIVKIEKVLDETQTSNHNLLLKFNNEWNIIIESEVLKKVSMLEDGTFQVEKVREIKFKNDVIKQINIIERSINFAIQNEEFSKNKERLIVSMLLDELRSLTLIKSGLIPFRDQNTWSIIKESARLNE